MPGSPDARARCADGAGARRHARSTPCASRRSTRSGTSGPTVIDSLRERLRSEDGRARAAGGGARRTGGDRRRSGRRRGSKRRCGRRARSPDALRRLLIEAGDQVALSTLHELVLAFRDYERIGAEDANEVAVGSRRARRRTSRWRSAAAGWRCSICATRSTEARPRRLDEFVAAAALIGDASCLEPLARAWRRSRNAEPDDARTSSRAGQAIMARERLTRAPRRRRTRC